MLLQRVQPKALSPVEEIGNGTQALTRAGAGAAFAFPARIAT